MPSGKNVKELKSLRTKEREQELTDTKRNKIDNRILSFFIVLKLNLNN